MRIRVFFSPSLLLSYALIGLFAVAAMPASELRARAADSGTADPAIAYKSTDYAVQQIAGWTVHVSRRLRAEQPEATQKALVLLRRQLEQVVREVPKPALAELQKVHLWVSPEYPGTGPKAEYHPDVGWLREHGRDSAMAKAVEFTNVRIFEAETRRMPNFALHELAHAYHDRVLGYGNKEIAAAYRRAKAGGKYDRVEQRHGDGRSHSARAYAMENPQEYFAETTEALFATNDIYPFTREELARHDPEMHRLLLRLWNVPAEASPTKARPSAKH